MCGVEEVISKLTHCAHRVRRVDGWIDIDTAEILEDYGEDIYDSDDLMVRKQLTREDLENLPFEDDQGSQIPIFDANGYHIQRRLASFREDEPACGILVKSGRLHDLFTWEDDDDSDNDPSGHTRPSSGSKAFVFYPQAGLKRVGHFQADGLITACYPLVSQISRRLHERAGSPNDNQDTFQDKIPIIGMSSQAYNSVTHHTRGRTAQHHEVQTGMVTGALAGAWASPNTPEARKASRLINRCNYKMPHKAFHDKIKNPDIPRDLRLENVYYIDLDALSPAARTGS